MTTENFKGMCRLVMSGEEAGQKKFVENMENHKVAKVVACTEDSIEVELKPGGRHAVWKADDCKEKTYGYKPVY